MVPSRNRSAKTTQKFGTPKPSSYAEPYKPYNPKP